MSAAPREIRAEDLLGRKVVDVNGEHVGRLEEMIIEHDALGGSVILAFHIGRLALLERWMDGAFGRALVRTVSRGAVATGFVVSWRDMDLSDPTRLRIRVPKSALGKAGDGAAYA